ncbi:hypothetical protein [Candidatus Villigracilis affinis]|uniref:hypothetical protein n=1 Tax=Candidatus Villigracilis affinis TaxID=3140682 RepID=UPI002A1EBFDF|nr:hypothetical protein [Anaerolineales bacterium]
MTQTKKTSFDFLTIATGLGAAFSAFALGVYAYLGIFSRHLADDYCSVDFIRTNFFSALLNNYIFVSDRYTNFMLIALSEYISPRTVTILPALFIALWLTGIAWMLSEASRFSKNGWSKLTIAALTFLVVFFALLQAPNRFQILYWRSAMSTHFAPLVFMPFLAAFILKVITESEAKSAPFWKYVLGFFIAFIIGGFSEPTVAVMITLLALAFAATWKWMSPSTRSTALKMIGWSLAGAVLALLIMGLAPANYYRVSLGKEPPTIFFLVIRSFQYGLNFIDNSFRTLPLPTLFTVAMPFFMFYNMYASPTSTLTESQRKLARTMLMVIPVLSYLLIVASFAPSVYGQSFPVERARFAGQVSLVAGLMIEGALLGSLLAQWRPAALEKLPLKLASAVLLAVAAFYPLRAGWLALNDIPDYRTRAEAWDTRVIQINDLIAQGETDLLIVQLDGVEGVKEMEITEKHWVNRCAAKYYEVNSIRTAPPK